MNILEKIEKGKFFLKNPAFSKWRKYEFDYQQYLKFNQPWLTSYRFNSILDIGANVGQSAIALSLAFPEAHVHSFEPIPDCYERLKMVTHMLPNATAHAYALGSATGEVSFERNAYSPSSSLLKITDKHIAHFPHTGSVTSTNVPVVKLDDYVDQLQLLDNTLIKIDVQGFEHEVIKGAENTLRRCKVVIVETSFETLYDKQPLFDEIYKAMSNLGFVYKGSFDQLQSPATGQNLQQDAIFIKV